MSLDISLRLRAACAAFVSASTTREDRIRHSSAIVLAVAEAAACPEPFCVAAEAAGVSAEGADPRQAARLLLLLDACGALGFTDSAGQGFLHYLAAKSAHAETPPAYAPGGNLGLAPDERWSMDPRFGPGAVLELDLPWRAMHFVLTAAGGAKNAPSDDGLRRAAAWCFGLDPKKLLRAASAAAASKSPERSKALFAAAEPQQAASEPPTPRLAAACEWISMLEEAHPQSVDRFFKILETDGAEPSLALAVVTDEGLPPMPDDGEAEEPSGPDSGAVQQAEAASTQALRKAAVSSLLSTKLCSAEFNDLARFLPLNEPESLPAEAWHDGLDLDGEAGACGGEIYRSILEGPFRAGRAGERLADGRHPLEALCGAIWTSAKSLRLPDGEKTISYPPRVRSLVDRRWGFEPGGGGRRALQAFVRSSGASGAGWLCARTIPEAALAFYSSGTPGQAALPPLPSPEDAARCAEHLENYHNDLWGAEPAGSESLWAEALLGAIQGELEPGSNPAKLRLFASAFRDAVSAQNAFWAGAAGADPDLEKSKGGLGTTAARCIAESRASAFDPKAARMEAAAVWLRTLVIGSGASDSEWRGACEKALGFGDGFPEGWGRAAGSEIRRFRAEERSLFGGANPAEAPNEKILLEMAKNADEFSGFCGEILAGQLGLGPGQPLLPAFKFGLNLVRLNWKIVFDILGADSSDELAVRLAFDPLSSACGPTTLSETEAKTLLAAFGPAAEDLVPFGSPAGDPDEVRERSRFAQAWIDGAGGRASERFARALARLAAARDERPGAAEAPPESVEDDALWPSGRAPTIPLWTPEEWTRFHSDITSLDNDDAAKNSRALIKKIQRGLVKPDRSLASAARLLRRIDELRARFPHFEAVIDRVEEFCVLQKSGDGSLWIPPLLMVGGAGIGKTYFASTLAEAAGTDLDIVDMASASAGWTLTGLSDSWSSGRPGRVHKALMTGALANPIILLDELEKSSGDRQSPVANVLLPLLEQHSASRFADECVPLRIDASKVCWMATANDEKTLPAPLLSRFDLFKLKNPNFAERRAMCGGIYDAVRKRHSWGAALAEALPEATLDKLAELAGEGAARDLRRAVTSGCAKACSAERSEVLPEDLPEPARSQRDPWDAPIEKEPCR